MYKWKLVLSSSSDFFDFNVSDRNSIDSCSVKKEKNIIFDPRPLAVSLLWMVTCRTLFNHRFEVISYYRRHCSIRLVYLEHRQRVPSSSGSQVEEHWPRRVYVAGERARFTPLQRAPMRSPYRAKHRSLNELSSYGLFNRRPRRPELSCYRELADYTERREVSSWFVVAKYGMRFVYARHAPYPFADLSARLQPDLKIRRADQRVRSVDPSSAVLSFALFPSRSISAHPFHSRHSNQKGDG